ncbi:MAG: thymidylate synthase [Mariprofundaceae bacterium]
MSIKMKPLLLAMFFVSFGAQAGEEPEKTATDTIVQRFMLLDSDESLSVSYVEFMEVAVERAEARFNAMDTNQDEEVTDDEYRLFWQEQKAQWYRIKR